MHSPSGASAPALDFRRLAGHLREAVLVINAEGRIEAASGRAGRLFGAELEALERLPIQELLPRTQPDQLRQLSQLRSADQRAEPLRIAARRRDGLEFPAELTVIQSAEENRLILLIHDVTLSQRQAQLRDLRLRLAEILAGSGTVTEAIPQILQTVVRMDQWDASAAWMIDPISTNCRRVAYVAEDDRSEQFYRETTDEFAQGVGLPGTVAVTAEPLWITDAENDLRLPRRDYVRRAGFHSLFGFPILRKGRAIGVLEFFSRSRREPDADLLGTVALVGQQIGEVLQRALAYDLTSSVVRQMQIGMVAFELAEAGGKPSLRMAVCNPAAGEMLGCPANELIGKSVAESFPDWPDPLRMQLSAVLRSGQSIQFDEPLNTTRGRRFISVRVFPIGNNGVGLLLEDITSRARHRDLVRGERLLLERVAADVPVDDLLSHAAEFIIAHIEGASCEIVWSSMRRSDIRIVRGEVPEHPDVSSEELDPWTIRAAWLPGDTQQEGRMGWLTGLRTNAGTTGTLLITVPRSSPPNDDERSVIGFVMRSLAIFAERLDAEDALRLSEERFRAAAKATSDIIWDWKIGTGERWWSEGFVERFGAMHDRTMDGWYDRIHPADLDRVMQSLKGALSGHASNWEDEFRLRRTDGTYATVIDRGLIIRDDAGRATRMIGAVVDITEKRRLLTELEQIKRVSSLGQLAASMAHEFNNVLMSIQPFADLIRRHAKTDDTLTGYSDRIRQSISRGRKITDEILRFTRSVQPVRKTVDVREWLSDFRSEAEALLEGKLTLELRLPEEKLFVSADPSQLNQVMVNLLINARDATRPGGWVRIGAERCCTAGFGLAHPGDYVHLTIEDNGMGMEKHVLDHIFDPLFTTKKGGTGLGLAISLQVVNAHEGKLIPESAPGMGTTFHLLLPRPKQAQIGQELQAEQPQRRLPKRVLIVEDEPLVAQGIAELLREEGVDCGVVHTGAEAVPAIEAFNPAVVVLDVGLPDVSGVEIYNEIVKRWPNRGIIFATGHYSRKELEHLLTQPHVGFLQKPFDIDQLTGLLVNYT